MILAEYHVKNDYRLVGRVQTVYQKTCIRSDVTVSEDDCTYYARNK